MTARLLKPQEVAERLGCTVKTLRGHVQDGSLRYVNVGRGEIRAALHVCRKRSCRVRGGAAAP